MSVTDTIRAMLDERGVEWTGTVFAEPTNGHPTNTSLGSEHHDAVFIEYRDGNVLRLFDLTPEQAIEATLGRGECRVVCSREYIECKVDFFECSECGWSGAIDDMKALCEYPRYCPNCGRKVRA